MQPQTFGGGSASSTSGPSSFQAQATSHSNSMASPPYYNSPTALSPPYPSHSQLPPINTMTAKKRTADGGGAPALKRRKQSTMSVTSGAGSAHPLRQTSFPPDEVGTPFDARSPSADLDAMSLVSGSQVSAAAPAKKKRGRKSKAEKAREQTPSVAGGRAPTAVSGVSDGGGRGGKTGAGAAAGGEDGDGDDDGPTEVAATAATMTKEQKEEEHRARGMLINAFSPEQFDRFENWRAANFSKAGVRRVCLPHLASNCPGLTRLTSCSCTACERYDITVRDRKCCYRNARCGQGLHR